MQTYPIDKKTVEALLQRGRTRMVQAYVNESGLIDPQEMHTFWRGFANCASALLNGAAHVMASHDQATDPERLVQAAFACLPDDLECLTLADMKRHMWAQGIDCAANLIANCNVDAVVQLQDAMGAPLKQDDKHAVAGVDVGDGCGLHGESLVVVGADIVDEDARTDRERSLLAALAALAAILLETANNPELKPYSSDSYLPPHLVADAVEALKPYGWPA